MTSSGVILIFFLFVMGAIFLAGYFVLNRGEAAEEQPRPMGSILVDDQPPVFDVRASLMPLFTWLGQAVPASEASRDNFERRLRYAGYRSPTAYSTYFGLKCASALLLAFVLCVLAVVVNKNGSIGFAALVCGLGLGFLIPERVIDAQIRSRNQRLRRSLPPALDIIVMSLEGGQAIDQALLAASRGLRVLMPDLSAEFAQTHIEARMNNGRAEAIQAMANRNSEPELKKLCQLLVDSDRFGSSLAPTLRQHSKFLRVRFRQKAQESARKLTVKLVFPLFFLIFPAILVVTLGPAVLTFRKMFVKFF